MSARQIMSAGRPAPDPAVARRMERLRATVGETFDAALEASLSAGSVLERGGTDELIRTFELSGPRDVMLLALGTATRLARPPISGYRVGAVGLDARRGDMILGGNVEFPGHDLTSTIHGEGFVMARAFARDAKIDVLAVGRARPCAHCRQTIVEFAGASELVVIDPLGHARTMADLYPWPFTPGDLGHTGIVAGVIEWPDLAISSRPGAGLRDDIRDLLVATGRRAHAPYSRCPAAVVLRLADGTLLGGASIENVAFDPSISPLQAAIVELLAFGRRYDEIESAYFAGRDRGDIDLSHATRALLSAIAPEAPLTIVTWH